MRREVREFLNKDKTKKRHESVIMRNKRPDRPPPGFNHWPTFDEIITVLEKRQAKANQELVTELSNDFKLEVKEKIKEKDKALDKLLASLGLTE